MTTARNAMVTHVPSIIRHYRITSIYVIAAVAAVLALLIWGRTGGPIHAVCAAPTATTQGENR